MLIRCPHCKSKLEYEPKSTRLGRKYCTVCFRWFQVKDQDIILQDRNPLRRDRNKILIKQIADWMENGHRITTTNEVKEAFNLTKITAWRILKKMENYEIVQKTEGGWSLFHKYIADEIETYEDLPEYCEWHFIKVKCNILNTLPLNIITQRLDQMGITYNLVEMRGDWQKLFIYPQNSDWSCIEVNKNTVFMNYNGIIRTANPVATVNDLEVHDLISAIAVLQRIGVYIDDHISDIHGHWALLGQKLRREEIGIYENIWSDESTGSPELETDSIEVAQNLIETIKTIGKVEKYLQLRFFNRERHVFFTLKEKFKKKAISFMQYLDAVQRLDTFQLFRAAHNFRVQMIAERRV